MNKSRLEKLQRARDLVEDVMEEEQEALETLLERMPDSEKGESMTDNCDNLESAID